VLRHPLTLAYLGVSGLAGLGLTYYYNDSHNRKVNTMLRVALQLVGLAAVYLRRVGLGRRVGGWMGGWVPFRAAWGAAGQMHCTGPAKLKEVAAAAQGRHPPTKPSPAKCSPAQHTHQPSVNLPLSATAAYTFCCCSASMPEASIALCAGLLGAKGYGFLQQHRSLRSALASAKQNVRQQLASDSHEATAEGGPAGLGPPAAHPHVTVVPVTLSAEQQRTPAAMAARPQQVPEVSPLIQRGECAPTQPSTPAAPADQGSIADVCCCQTVSLDRWNAMF
jgi:hypothetical protein